MIIFMTEEERYSNRQIERMFDEQSRDLKEHFDDTIEPLTVQVTKTNGRLRWAERMIWVAMGALVILTPLMTWALVQIVGLKDSIKNDIHTQTQTAVQDVLSQYEIKITK